MLYQLLWFGVSIARTLLPSLTSDDIIFIFRELRSKRAASPLMALFPLLSRTSPEILIFLVNRS
jgi:hypothetical protein